MERMTIRGDHGVYMAPGWDFHIDPDDYELVQKVLDRIATFEDLLERVEMEPPELVEVLQRNFNADLMLSMTAHYLQGCAPGRFSGYESWSEGHREQ